MALPIRPIPRNATRTETSICSPGHLLARQRRTLRRQPMSGLGRAGVLRLAHRRRRVRGIRRRAHAEVGMGQPDGVSVTGPMKDDYAEILTEEALAFVAELPLQPGDEGQALLGQALGVVVLHRHGDADAVGLAHAYLRVCSPSDTADPPTTVGQTQYPGTSEATHRLAA